MAPRIDTLRASVRRQGYDSRRSKLWVYMRENHAKIKEMIDGGASWPVLAKAFGEAGLTDGSEPPKVPTADTARKTWDKVDGIVASRPIRAPRRERIARPRLPEEMAPVLPEVTPERSGGGTVADFSAEPEQPRRKFRRGATFRGTEEEG